MPPYAKQIMPQDLEGALQYLIQLTQDTDAFFKESTDPNSNFHRYLKMLVDNLSDEERNRLKQISQRDNKILLEFLERKNAELRLGLQDQNKQFPSTVLEPMPVAKATGPAKLPIVSTLNSSTKRKISTPVIGLLFLVIFIGIILMVIVFFK